MTDLSSGQVDCRIITYPTIIGVGKSELRSAVARVATFSLPHERKLA